ncbi:unnamed protein product [Urochloa humidicola]
MADPALPSSGAARAVILHLDDHSLPLPNSTSNYLTSDGRPVAPISRVAVLPLECLCSAPSSRATGRGLRWPASTTLSPPPHPVSSRSHYRRPLPRGASPGSHGGSVRGRKTAMVRSRGGRRPDLYPLNGTTNFIHE